MPSTISLRRGLDWVSTGLYNPTQFNTATDYVAKYTLVNINGDTAAYKAKVYLVTGTENQYCIQHTDGTIYVLDGYDPFDCVYYMHYFRRCIYSSSAGFSARSVAVDNFMVMPKNFVTCPMVTGYRPLVKSDALNPYYSTHPSLFGSDKVGSSLSTYAVDGSGNKQIFTQYYYDPVNGVPSQWTGIEYIPVKDHCGINSANSVQFESAAYHRLFFQDEPFTFLNTDPSIEGLESLASSGALQRHYTEDVPNYPAFGRNGYAQKGEQAGNQVDFSEIFGSTKSLNFLIPSGCAPYSSDPLADIYARRGGRGQYGPYDNYVNVGQSFTIDPYYQYYTCYQSDVMGCYTNSSGVRVNLIQAGYVPKTPFFESLGTIQSPSTLYVSCRYYACKAPDQFHSESTIGTLTPIAFPTLALRSQTVALRNLPAPAPSSTGITLYKGVDYVLTGIYSPSDFAANSIVVKCKIDGNYVKLPVQKVTSTIFAATNTVGGVTKTYLLDGFDPFEVYYTLVPTWGNVRQTWTMQKDKTNSRMMRTFDKYPHFPSRIQPTGYSVSGSYNNSNTPMQYFYTSASGTRAQFSHFSFDNTGDMTIQHGGELFLFDPATIQIANPLVGQQYTSFTPTTQTRSLQYHQLFLAEEKCKAYNCTPDNMGNEYGDGRPTVDSVTNFLFNRMRINEFSFDDRGQVMKLFGQGLDTGDIFNGLGDYGSSDHYTAEFLESSITLEPSMAYTQEQNPFFFSQVLTKHAVAGAFYQNGNNMFPETNYSRTFLIGTKITVPSSAGLYVDGNGNRFDIVKLSHYGGFYTCVESLSNRVSNTNEWRTANGLTCILDNLPTAQVGDLLAAQIEASRGTGAQIATLQANIASSAAQIAALQAQVAALDGDALVTAQAQIITLEANIASYTAQIATLQAQVDAANQPNVLLELHIFGRNINITNDQAIGSAILAGAALVISVIIYFGPTIFR